MLPKLATNHCSELCTWLKAPTAIISSPKLICPLKYTGEATRMGTTCVSQP